MAASYTASTQPTDAEEHLYKILVIGEFGVGKTSIIKRYTEGFFSPNYKLTIGVDFALKTVDWHDNIKVNLQLWYNLFRSVPKQGSPHLKEAKDIAGHERFGHMTRVYYKYAIAAIIVFDLSRPATFDSVLKWLNDVNSKVMLANEKPVPVILLANKCDIDNVYIDDAMLSKFCSDHNFIGWFSTSAKTDVNIEKAMNFLIEHILSLPTDSKKPEEHLDLHTSLGSSTNETFQSEEVTKTKTCCS